MPERRDDGADNEAELQRMLREVGPLLRRREEVETADPTFVARLRTRFAPDQEHAETPSRVPSPGIRRRASLRIAALAAAIAVVVVVVVAVIPGPWRQGHTPGPAWHVPLPSVADLSRGFPAALAARGATVVSPVVSLAAHASGVPYAGHVTFTTVPLPAPPGRLQAFRLAAATTLASPARLLRLAHAFGISGTLQHARQSGTTWIVTAARASLAVRSLHSLAISAATGELVYHDTSYIRQEPWIDNPSAVAAARSWLTRLGWPGTRMPLLEIGHSGIPAGLRAIAFQWAGAGQTATAAALLWVTPHGRVVEADVWPVVSDAASVPVRSLTSAWSLVRRQLAPLAVADVPPHATAPGQALMRRVTVTYVRSMGADRRLYLTPVYHFAGTVRLRGIHGARACYALAPAGQAAS